jgi:hypothetical protein
MPRTLSPPYNHLPCLNIYLKRCEEEVINNWEGDNRTPGKNAFTSENIPKLMIEELTKVVAASVMLEDDDQFKVQLP